MSKPKTEGPVTEDQKETFKALQDRFYKKLKDEGFVDIEQTNIPDRPLKEWHGLKYSSEKVLQKIKIRQEYQKLLDNFTNHKDFDEICFKLINRKYQRKILSLNTIKSIWYSWAHLGYTERRIAKDFNLSKTNIHQILERFRKWMAIL